MMSETLDIFNPWLPNPPSEWAAIPPEILERLIPNSVMRVSGLNGDVHLFNTRGILTPTQYAEMEKLARGRWFLLRNDGPHGERLRCGRCKGLHQYFTLACVERPFHGLQEIAGLMQRVVGRDLAFEAVRIGTIEPISRAKALQLRKRIERRGEQLS